MSAARAMLLGLCAALGACASDSDHHGHRGGRETEDGVPAAICLLKPMAPPAGSLTMQQLDIGIKAAFAAADVNHDGWLDKAETAKVNAAKQGTCDRSPLIDWSGTGRIGITDFAAQYHTAFQRTDEDGDGVVTAEEMKVRPHYHPTEEDDPDAAKGHGGHRRGGNS